MNRETLISVDQVTRYYADYCAIKNISFTVNRGEVLGFLGPNGAGKTTTMQIISGVLTASKGAVSIAGIDIIDDPISAKAHLGFLPEQPPLYIDLSVDEYLVYAARLRGINKAAVNNAVENSKQRCGLEDVGVRLIRNLSRGYQQRVGIAQAIIHSPAVVILDEPTNGLDPIQIHEIRQLIKELGDDHSVILSTHILSEVQTVCDRVLIINEGQLVLDKPLDDLNEDTGQRFIRIAFRQPPSIDTLTSIDGINNVIVIDDHRFRIRIDPESQALDTVIQRSSNSCWGLFEIIPESNTLEEIFFRLTQGETHDHTTPDTGTVQ